MYLRPILPTTTYQYCVEPIDWTVVKKLSEVVEVQTTCRTNQQNIFRMCVAIQRDNYPQDVGQMLPGHTISILAPITITNLLPHELMYSAGVEKGQILPGKSSDLLTPNINDQLEITVELDGYSGAGMVCFIF
jgi:vacuolar protein sorting-associated protein 13D